MFFAAQRFALPALGRGRRSRPARKMTRRRKLLEIAAESPASGARFVGRFCCYGHSAMVADATYSIGTSIIPGSKKSILTGGA